MTETKSSAWTGWIAFAVIVLVIEGAFGLLVGFVALFQDDILLRAPGTTDLYLLNTSGWGWIHIFWSVLALFGAASLAQGKMFGRVVAVVVASLGAIANMAFVPIYPIWSIIMVTLCIVVIWAVIVHGGEVKDELQNIEG